MIKKNFKYLILALCVVLNVISSIVVLVTPSFINQYGQEVTYVLDTRQWTCSIALLVVLVVVFFKNKYWSQLFAVVLLLGVFNVFQFYSTVFFVGIGNLHLEVFSLAMLFVHLSLNRGTFSAFVKYFGSFKKDKQAIEQSSEAKYNRFLKKFENKNEEQLQAIANNELMVPEARKAAVELLKSYRVN